MTDDAAAQSPAFQLRNDSGALVNALTGLGTANDSLMHTQVGTAVQLSQAEMDELAQVWPLDVMCTAFPDAATAKWCELTLPEGVEPTVRQDFDQYRKVVASVSKQSDLRDEEIASDSDIFSWAGYLANVYGGAAIVLNIDDGRHPSQPIDTENIRTIKELTVLDRFQIYPDLTTVDDPFTATHYNIVLGIQRTPELQAMFSGHGGFNSGYRTRGSYQIHRSRVLRIPGVRVPPRVMQRNNGWDRSLLEKVYERYVRWESTNSAVQDLISDYSLFVYKLEGLGQMLTSADDADEKAISARVRSLFLMAKTLGGIMLDKSDEDVSFVQRSFAGLEGLLEVFRDMLIGASDIPHTQLFGESPSGLGATGESEEKTWSAKVDSYRFRVFDSRVRRLYELIFLAKDGPTQGQRLEGWDITWPKLIEQTQSEVLSDRQTQANVDQAYKDMGVLTAEEIRCSRYGMGNYSHETTLAEAEDAELDHSGQSLEQDQVRLLIEVIQAVTAGELPPANAAALVRLTVPSLGEAAVRQLLSPQAQPPSPPLLPQAPTLEVVADSAPLTADLLKQAEAEAAERFQVPTAAWAKAWTMRRYAELARGS